VEKRLLIELSSFGVNEWCFQPFVLNHAFTIDRGQRINRQIVNEIIRTLSKIERGVMTTSKDFLT
jgi:hypothetical protein